MVDAGAIPKIGVLDKEASKRIAGEYIALRDRAERLLEALRRNESRELRCAYYRHQAKLFKITKLKVHATRMKQLAMLLNDMGEEK